jgi:hypothetical protein
MYINFAKKVIMHNEVLDSIIRSKNIVMGLKSVGTCKIEFPKQKIFFTKRVVGNKIKRNFDLYFLF